MGSIFLSDQFLIKTKVPTFSERSFGNSLGILIDKWAVYFLYIHTHSIYFVAENLVLWARSEIIGYAICPIYSWFQVSGFRFQVSGKNES
jgi:hypothetical protein